MVLTVYNCGTGYGKANDDLVAQFHRATSGEKCITDGPGTQKLGQGKLLGIGTGQGVNANVKSVVAEIQTFMGEGTEQKRVNLLGWSRGAVTCFKIANKVARTKSAWARRVEFNIFAVDPVPGPVPFNFEMWKGIRTTENINNCLVIHAVNEARRIMPAYAPGGVRLDTMPGNHRALVESTPEFRAVCEIVRDRALRFLSDNGTRFAPLTSAYLLTDAETIERYAEAHITPIRGKKAKGERQLYHRPPRGQKLKKKVVKISRAKPVFFYNEHHRAAFARVFPLLAGQIVRSQNSFETPGWPTGVSHEFARLEQSRFANTRKQIQTFFDLADL